MKTGLRLRFTALALLMGGLSAGQTAGDDASVQTERISLGRIRATAGESRYTAWNKASTPIVSILSTRTTPVLDFPIQVNVDAGSGGTQLHVVAPPATPAGEYTVDINGRSADGPVSASFPMTVDAVTVPNAVSGGRGPVILLNGWQFSCPQIPDSSLAASEDTFGQLHSLLQAQGVPVVFFNNCMYQGVPIETLAARLSTYIAGLHYPDGTPVTEVDLVTHSMGGLIARAYLAGLQTNGVPAPPADPKVRKLVEIATPNFGSFWAVNSGVQVGEMYPGSDFLWNLGRWNQGGDDLRGVDALSIIGNAGSCCTLLFPSWSNASDGVVSVTSGSLGFASLGVARSPSRTRILPYCHTDAVPLPNCSGPPIANVDKAPETGAIVLSFLADSSEWMSRGAPNQNQYGGAYFALVNADNPQLIHLSTVSLGTQALQSGATDAIFFSEFVNGTATFQVTTTSFQTTTCGPFAVAGGYYVAFRCKYGPIISLVGPVLSNVPGLVVKSGGTITINGVGFGPQPCTNCGVWAYPGQVKLQVSSWSDQAIAATLPAFTGFVQLLVQAASGSDVVNIMAGLPPAPPSISLSTAQLQFSYTVGAAPPPAQAVVVSNAGSGTFTWSAAASASWLTLASASGLLTVSINPTGLSPGAYNGTITITGIGAANSPQTVSVTLTVSPAPTIPVIANVVNAFGDSPVISPNSWVAIKGTNLAPHERNWQPSDFVNNQMPTALDAVSVTMNGKNAYLYSISPNQLNILPPPDLALGPVQVLVANNGAVSAAFTVQAQQYSPSFFVFDGVHVTGTHLDGSLLGPTSLYPGSSTPSKPNETLILYGNGFGPTSSPVVSGSVVQSGSLPVLPVVRIGGIAATVQFAGLISPGLFQFNVIVPTSVPDGDNAITATYNGLTTQAGAVLAVQH